MKFIILNIFSLIFTLNVLPQNTSDKVNNAFKNALSHYPEIDSNSIIIKKKCICASMQARPHISYFFSTNRKYSIFVNNKKENTGFLPDSLPFDALTGLYGHELAHILYYKSISRGKMIKTGFQYLFKKNIKKMERETDSIAISKGLGYHILQFRIYVDTFSTINLKYKKRKEVLYMKQHELIKLIDYYNNTVCDSLKN